MENVVGRAQVIVKAFVVWGFDPAHGVANQAGVEISIAEDDFVASQGGKDLLLVACDHVGGVQEEKQAGRQAPLLFQSGNGVGYLRVAVPARGCVGNILGCELSRQSLE